MARVLIDELEQQQAEHDESRAEPLLLDPAKLWEALERVCPREQFNKG